MVKQWFEVLRVVSVIRKEPNSLCLSELRDPSVNTIYLEEVILSWFHR